MKKKATIYRMVTPKHLCPWGVKAWDLLHRHGYQVDDRHLTSSDANREYKQANGYDETPQIFIEDQRIGGYDALREHLGLGPDPYEGKTYRPVIAIFAATFLMALSVFWAFPGRLKSSACWNFSLPSACASSAF